MQSKKESPAQADPPAFEFNLITPFSTRTNGKPVPVPYVIHGLAMQGGFSVLGAKPKTGKSSLARAEAVAVAKGEPILGRTTEQGEILLVSLEDPLFHVDNALDALGYDEQKDAPIHIITELPPVDHVVEELGNLLSKRPDTRLVVIDHLAMMLRIDDINEYMPMLHGVQQLRDLARRFPKVHIQALTHAKKVRTDDPFDALLGSTALRGVPDCNIAIFEEDRQRVIVSESRIGKAMPPTILKGELVDVGGADVVKGFSLQGSLEEYQANKSESRELKQKISYEADIIAFLKTQPELIATQEATLKGVKGRTANLRDAVSNLEQAGVVTISGTKQSPADPLKLKLNPNSTKMSDFINRFV